MDAATHHLELANTVDEQQIFTVKEVVLNKKNMMFRIVITGEEKPLLCYEVSILY